MVCRVGSERRGGNFGFLVLHRGANGIESYIFGLDVFVSYNRLVYGKKRVWEPREKVTGTRAERDASKNQDLGGVRSWRKEVGTIKMGKTL